MRLSTVIAIALWLTFGFSSSSYAAPMFMGLGDLADGSFDSLPWGVSADGSVVVGYGDYAWSGDYWKSSRWDATNGMVASATSLGGFSGATP